MLFSPLRLLRLILISSICVLSCQQLAFALPQWEFNPETSQLRFTLKSSVTPSYFWLENPTRLVIDLPNTQIQGESIQRKYQGLVQEVRIGQFEPETARIVLELAPYATFTSNSVSLEPIVASEGNQWQLDPNIKTIEFPLSTLMTIPPLEENTIISSQQVQVPPPPSTKTAKARESPPELSLSAGTQFQLRYRGEKTLKLKAEQPWQEVLFLEENLTNEKGELIAAAQTPVIGHFENTAEGTRFVTQALITSLNSAQASPINSVIPLQAYSSLFNDLKLISESNKITIPPDTILTVELREDWKEQRSEITPSSTEGTCSDRWSMSRHLLRRIEQREVSSAKE